MVAYHSVQFARPMPDKEHRPDRGSALEMEIFAVASEEKKAEIGDSETGMSLELSRREKFAGSAINEGRFG